VAAFFVVFPSIPVLFVDLSSCPQGGNGAKKKPPYDNPGSMVWPGTGVHVLGRHQGPRFAEVMIPLSMRMSKTRTRSGIID